MLSSVRALFITIPPLSRQRVGGYCQKLISQDDIDGSERENNKLHESIVRRK
jgi:hypothetical protein